MVLEPEMRQQLSQYLQLLEDNVLIKMSAGTDAVSNDMLALLDELTSLSPKISVQKTHLPRTPSFSVNRVNQELGVTFAGVPLGHEFTSLVLAILQVSGRTPKVDESVINQIKDIHGEYHFETYVSLSCHNCPEVGVCVATVPKTGISSKSLLHNGFNMGRESLLVRIQRVFLERDAINTAQPRDMTVFSKRIASYSGFWFQ